MTAVGANGNRVPVNAAAAYKCGRVLVQRHGMMVCLVRILLQIQDGMVLARQNHVLSVIQVSGEQILTGVNVSAVEIWPSRRGMCGATLIRRDAVILIQSLPDSKDVMPREVNGL